MQINASLIYKGSKETEIQVISSRCRYTVWFARGVISLRGPGVRETADIEQEFDSLEEYAMMIVLLFENNLWPEE